MTPLLFAAKGGHEDCIELLLQRGADPNRCREGEPDAAKYAAKSSAGALRVVLASLVELPILEDLFYYFDLTLRPSSDSISLALASGCWMVSALSYIKSRIGLAPLPVVIDCSLHYTL